MADGFAIQSDPCVWSKEEEDFLPPRWLRNPHLQSIFSTLPWPRPRLLRDCRGLLAASRREIVDCGDGVRLVAYRAVQRAQRASKVRRLAVLLHGWEGSSDSADLVSLAQHLFDRDFDVVRLNLRDHGETHHLNVGLFHSCRLGEIIGAVRSLQARHPRHELSCVGFSLGGNFGLRLGACARAEGLDIAHVVAVCPVIDPARSLWRLDTSAGVYRRYLMHRWRRSLLRKSAAWPSRYDFYDMVRKPTLTQMADHFVRRYTSFPSLHHYLKGYTLLGNTLRGLDVDAWLVAATDDPIIPVEDVDRLPTLRTLRVTRTRFGGHCGFYEGKPGPSWLERRIERTLSGL
jgi:hypothetical protein